MSFNMEKKDIVVVIPVYDSRLSADENISLAQCISVLSEYQIVIIKPEKLDASSLVSKYSTIRLESFPDECFASLRAYNKLVLDEAFYLRFQQYDYILIYQLDAYVFKDELLYWALKGYDYIGAPWIPKKKSHLTCGGRSKILLRHYLYDLFNNEKRKLEKYYNYQVGNGGFSLRKISKMITITRYYKEKIDSYLDDNKPFYPEDVFLFLELTSRKCRLYKPGYKEALKFSMEQNPSWSFQYNKGKLPFGCHDWNHEQYSPFWNSIIKPSK